MNDDGLFGVVNDVKCVGLEEKLGIYGSFICVMFYGENGECYGMFFGEENKGF